MTIKAPILRIGDLVLDDTYAPLVNVSFEYFKTKGAEIIGGLQKFTITGTVTVGDEANLVTGANVMAKLKQIRDVGKKTKCVNVNLPGFYVGQAKITNVTIDQGSDPSWINQGQFSIEVSARLSSIPTNSLGITVEDNVVDISRSETVEIGEDAHGYVVSAGQSVVFSKTFVKYSVKANLTCRPLCPNMGGQNSSTISVLKKILTRSTQNQIINRYRTWIPMLQNRSLEISTEGSVSFNADIILLPPNSSFFAFVDISFEHNRSYQDKKTSKKINGTVNGLAPIQWNDLINISDTSSASKLANAEIAFQAIKSQFFDLSSWGGNQLELLDIPGCPVEESDCGKDKDNAGDIKPTSSTISKNRTDGVINFDFEWSSGDSGDCVDENGIKKEVTVEVTEPQPSLIEHVIPGVGTLLQDLNCLTAKTVDFTSTTTYPDSSCGAEQQECETENRINEEIRKYIPPEGGDGWLVIKHTKTKTKNSFIINKRYIRKCLPKKK